jgi:hypothetical protein
MKGQRAENEWGSGEVLPHDEKYDSILYACAVTIAAILVTISYRLTNGGGGGSKINTAYVTSEACVVETIKPSLHYHELCHNAVTDQVNAVNPHQESSRFESRRHIDYPQ